MQDNITYKYKGYKIKIIQDDAPMNPRVDFDNLGTMVCFHRQYTLGDEHSFTSPNEVMEHIKKTKAIWLPVYMYDHGGITLNTTGFSCPWDSGQVGVIFVEKEKIYKDQQVKKITPKMIDKVKELLKGEVKIYSQYLEGDVWFYEIKNPLGGEEDSCGGYFGHECCIKEAKSYVDSLIPNSVEFIKVVGKSMKLQVI